MKPYILIFLLWGACWACSDNEDLTPSHNDRNMFDMQDFSSPEEMQLRRNFHEETSSYLIFNDSLYYRNLTTPQGSDPELVMLDMKYQISGTTDKTPIRYSLLKNMEDKELATKFLKEEILSWLSPAFYSYAFFMVDEFFSSVEEFDLDIFEYVWIEFPAEAYAGYNATLIAYNDFYSRNETERYSYKRKVLKTLVEKTHSQIKDSEYDDFYNVLSKYYKKRPEQKDEEGKGDYEESILELGYLTTYQSSWGISFWEKKYDLLAYVTEIYSLTQEEFDEKYDKEQYPLVHQKKNALVKIFERHGVRVY